MSVMTDLNSKRIVMTYRRAPTRPGWEVLTAIVAATLLAAVAGSLASLNAPDFYRQLVQPAWAPPAWLFGPVWTLLFLMMAASAWLVVKGRPLSSSRTQLTLYGAQLVFNGLWSWLFFRWQLGAAAFADVLVLLVLVALMARTFYRVQPLAGWLMLPYLAWVAFASALTYSVWQGNPGVL